MNIMASIPLKAGPARFSAAEFLHMVESDAFGDIKVELIDGELVRMPPPGHSHAALQAKLLVLLGGTVMRALLVGETGIDLGNDTIVACDAAVLKAPFEEDGMVPAKAVALVVEIAISTLDRDLGMKRRLYAAAGIPTYWVIDANREVVHIFDSPEYDDYVGLALAKFGEPMAVPGADGTIMLR